MAIGTVVTRGYGNGTLTGTIALVVTRGYMAAVSTFANSPRIVYSRAHSRSVTSPEGTRTVTAPEDARTVYGMEKDTSV
jgi:hypothetical protein